MTSYEGASIEVINWEKYNPRTDAKRPQWFRLDNSLATGPGFHDLDCEQKWLWIVILSLVSQKNGGAIEWKSSYIEAITGIKPKKQFSALETFEKFVRLRVSRKVTSSNISDAHATNITNEHNEQDITDTATPGDSPEIAHSELFTESTQDILAGVSLSVQDSWIKAYGDIGWLRQELAKAWAWLQANPKKRPKGNCARFVTNWLARGWESYRKGIPSQPQNYAYKRMAGNQAALETVLQSMGVKDGKTG